MTRPPKRQRADHQLTAAALRQRPGVWLVVGEYRSNISAEGAARDIRNGYQRRDNAPNPYTPAGAFEARMVQTEFGTNILARYIGEAR